MKQKNQLSPLELLQSTPPKSILKKPTQFTEEELTHNAEAIKLEASYKVMQGLSTKYLTQEQLEQLEKFTNEKKRSPYNSTTRFEDFKKMHEIRLSLKYNTPPYTSSNNYTYEEIKSKEILEGLQKAVRNTNRLLERYGYSSHNRSSISSYSSNSTSSTSSFNSQASDKIYADLKKVVSNSNQQIQGLIEKDPTLESSLNKQKEKDSSRKKLPHSQIYELDSDSDEDEVFPRQSEFMKQYSNMLDPNHAKVDDPIYDEIDPNVLSQLQSSIKGNNDEKSTERASFNDDNILPLPLPRPFNVNSSSNNETTKPSASVAKLKPIKEETSHFLHKSLESDEGLESDKYLVLKGDDIQYTSF